MTTKRRKNSLPRPAKAAKFKGRGFEFEADVIETVDYEVTEAIITAERIAMDWVDNGQVFHVTAKSDDGGATYRGHFGAPLPDAQWEMHITRYTSKSKTELLMARWVQRDLAGSGLDIITLSRRD